MDLMVATIPVGRREGTRTAGGAILILLCRRGLCQEKDFIGRNREAANELRFAEFALVRIHRPLYNRFILKVFLTYFGMG